MKTRARFIGTAKRTGKASMGFHVWSLPAPSLCTSLMKRARSKLLQEAI